jgi:hypothetical protein
MSQPEKKRKVEEEEEEEEPEEEEEEEEDEEVEGADDEPEFDAATTLANWKTKGYNLDKKVVLNYVNATAEGEECDVKFLWMPKEVADTISIMSKIKELKATNTYKKGRCFVYGHKSTAAPIFRAFEHKGIPIKFDDLTLGPEDERVSFKVYNSAY